MMRLNLWRIIALILFAANTISLLTIRHANQALSMTVVQLRTDAAQLHADRIALDQCAGVFHDHITHARYTIR